MTAWKVIVVCWMLATAGFLLLGWLNYRGKKREATAKEAMRKRHAFGPWRWSQDGWVRVCKFCQMPDYGGDDYEGGPE